MADLAAQAGDDVDPIWPLVRKQAYKSTMHFKLGAVLVKKGKVVAKGYNNNKTHPKLGSGWAKSLHAEGDCIYDALKKGVDLRGCVLYVYRKNWNMAKPCDCCMSIIRKYKIKKVIYTSKYNDERTFERTRATLR